MNKDKKIFRFRGSLFKPSLVHFATVLSIIGAILLSTGYVSLVVYSLIFQILGGILWSIYSINTAQYPLLTVNIAFIVVEIIGIIRWI